MAPKKDFSNINTGRVYDQIEQATAQPAGPSKKGRQFTEDEKQDMLMNGRTRGQAGVKQKRINMAFYPDVYEYINIMSRVTGLSRTEFVNTALRQHMKDNMNLYGTAKKFKQTIEEGTEEE